MLNISTPEPGIYRRWITALWGGIIAFSVVALTGILVLESGIELAADSEKLSKLEQKIERGFNHYNLDELKEARALERQVWIIPGKDRFDIGRGLFLIGTVTCLLLLGTIFLHKLFRWIWLGKP